MASSPPAARSSTPCSSPSSSSAPAGFNCWPKTPADRSCSSKRKNLRPSGAAPIAATRKATPSATWSDAGICAAAARCRGNTRPRSRTSTAPVTRAAERSPRQPRAELEIEARAEDVAIAIACLDVRGTVLDAAERDEADVLGEDVFESRDERHRHVAAPGLVADVTRIANARPCDQPPAVDQPLLDLDPERIARALHDQRVVETHTHGRLRRDPQVAGPERVAREKIDVVG